MATSPGAPIRDEGLWGDIQALLHIIGFCLRAVLRRKKLVLFTVIAMTIMGCLAVVAMPRRYVVSARLQSNRAYLINSLATGRRPAPSYADNPVAGVWERTHSRDFLDRLIDEVDLTQRWRAGRVPLARFKDSLRAMLTGPLEGPVLRRALRNMLEERVQTKIEGGVIVFEVYWFDPNVAHDLAIAVVDKFLEIQQDLELDQINDTLDIINGRLEASSLRLNETADRLEVLVEEKSQDVRKELGAAAKTKAKSRVMSFRRSTTSSDLPPEAKQREAELAATQRRMATLEKDYKRDFERAQDRLATARDTLGPQHPDYRKAVRELEVFSEPPEELQRLRAQEDQLLAEISQFDRKRRNAAASPEAPVDIDQRFDVVSMPMTGDVYTALMADPDIENLMGELRKYVQDHNDLIDRRDQTSLELDTSKAAFNYRYILTEPPAYPEGPVSPKIPLIVVASIFGGCFFGFFLAVLADILTRRILEPWQLEALLNVRVVGESHSEL